MKTWWLIPAVSFGVLIIAIAAGVSPLLAVICAAGLVGAVIAAVHHAEVVAHRVGEPFGTLVLAVAVTVIEASLILSMVFAGGKEAAVIPRDTIYAAIMIILNGVVGLCILVGGITHHEQTFRVEGTSGGLDALIVMSALSLIMPTFTTTTPIGTYNNMQLGFVAVTSAALWAVFVFVQTVRHRDYFLPVQNAANPEAHAKPPTKPQALLSFGLLVVCLVTVVGLAKVLTPTVERLVVELGAPKAVIGIVIAMLVLLPETAAATRAARANRLQTSMNLAIGSALASIGLTIPVVAVAAIVFKLPLHLGLDSKDLVMLVVTLLSSMVTLGTGRTYLMQGAVHLVLFAAFLFLAFVP
ncbi:MAG TPA: ionic transporter y4hA [Thermoanaerobaculia bacterium]